MPGARLPTTTEQNPATLAPGSGCRSPDPAQASTGCRSTCTEAKRVAHEVAAEWGLELGEAFSMSNVSYVAAVGDDAVLKVAWAGDDESLHEDAALELWAGDGAVRTAPRRPRATGAARRACGSGRRHLRPAV